MHDNIMKNAISLLSRRVRLGGSALISGQYGLLLNMVRNAFGVIFEPISPGYSPMFLVIEPTNRCNLKCATCINSQIGSGRVDLGLGEFKKIISNFPYLKKISLVGLGEPLLNPFLFEMIGYAKSNNIEIGFTTNGTILDRTKAEALIESGADWVSFSIDSPIKETYERIRLGANFERTVENIKYFVSRAKDRIRTNILVVVTRQNLMELPRFFPLLNDIGINKLDLQATHFWGNQDFKDKMDASTGFDTDSLLKLSSIMREARRFSIDCAFMNMPDMEKGRGCKWPWRASYISASGQVTPCCLGGADTRNINFGNIFKIGSFLEIWRGAAYTSFRKSLKSSTPPPICRTCPSYYHFRNV